MAHFDVHQSEFELTPYRAADLLAQVRAEFFSHLRAKVEVMYARIPLLARILVQPRGSPLPHLIQISSLLNQPGMPVEVIRHILIHELIHLEVAPGHDEHSTRPHPPEFWVRENELSPDGALIFSWVLTAFRNELRPNETHERIDVPARAYKTFPVVERKQFQEWCGAMRTSTAAQDRAAAC